MEEDGPTGHPEWIRIARPDERHECEKNCLPYFNWERCSKLVSACEGVPSTDLSIPHQPELTVMGSKRIINANSTTLWVEADLRM